MNQAFWIGTSQRPTELCQLGISTLPHWPSLSDHTQGLPVTLRGSMPPPLAEVVIHSLSASLQFYSLSTVLFIQVFLSPKPFITLPVLFILPTTQSRQLAFLACFLACHKLALPTALTLINSLFCLTSSQQPATPWVLFPVTQINKLKVNLLFIDYD